MIYTAVLPAREKTIGVIASISCLARTRKRFLVPANCHGDICEFKTGKPVG